MDRLDIARNLMAEAAKEVDFYSVYEKYGFLTEDEAYDIARLIETANINIWWTNE